MESFEAKQSSTWRTFFTCAIPIMQRHGEEGRQAVCDALAAWGAERGSLLAKRHVEKGIKASLINFVRAHDLPARLIWPVREVEVTTTKVIVEIDETPQDEAFEDSKHSELGSLWYQHSYPAMAAAYLPGATAQWTRLRARGDETNRLELHCGEMEK